MLPKANQIGLEQFVPGLISRDSSLVDTLCKSVCDCLLGGAQGTGHLWTCVCSYRATGLWIGICSTEGKKKKKGHSFSPGKCEKNHTPRKIFSCVV